jgi:hypothetical protein
MGYIWREYGSNMEHRGRKEEGERAVTRFILPIQIEEERIPRETGFYQQRS